MNTWCLAIFCFLGGAFSFKQDLFILLESVGLGRQRKDLQKIVQVLREMEDTLLAGLVPSPFLWESLKELSEPWGRLTFDSLQGLRSCGGSLLPTLKRLRGVAEEHSLTLTRAQAKSYQALSQAGMCSLLVPLLGTSLYFLLPSIEENKKLWLLACLFAFILTFAGALWLFQLTESARWGGLRQDYRPWILHSQCAGEKFLALVRTGVPPDLSWIQAVAFLSKEAADLSFAWGHSVWQESGFKPKGLMEQSIVSAGCSIQKAIQVSLMEGRPCTERVEAVLSALRQDIQAHVERELSLLATRALQPLFICVAPALMGLLAFGIWLASSDVLMGGGGAF